MIDPLSCLREYTIKKKPIVEKNNYIIFGEYCWPKSVKTNYQVFNKQQDAAKEYYTLECLLFFLNNLKLSHVAYVNFARENDVPFVRRPDRKKLLAYLRGEISTSPSINTSAPVVYPTKIKLEEEKEITDVVRNSNFQELSVLSSVEKNFSRNETQSPSLQSVKREAEEQDEIDIKPNLAELSVLSSVETNFSRNEMQSPSLQSVIQVNEDHGKINKKRRIENSYTLSSSEANISRNEDQRYSNHDRDASTVKREAEEQDEIDIKPNLEELSLLLSNRRNISSN